MCVTLGSATMNNTMVYGYIPPEQSGSQRHVVGYQNVATNRTPSPNCMFLNFAGTDLRMVHGPEHTRRMMENITMYLPELEPIEQSRSTLGSRGSSRSATVENYGDYTVVVSQSPLAILEALERVPDGRRPVVNNRLLDFVNMFSQYYPNDTFVLACFSGKVKPKHPIVVSYLPHSLELLTVPGLDGHGGTLPERGVLVKRDFKVAFGMHGINLRPVEYRDVEITKKREASVLWAPSSTIGFVDNRLGAPNGNYSLPVDSILSSHLTNPGVTSAVMDLNERGMELAGELVLSNL